MHDTAVKSVPDAVNFLKKATTRRPDAAVVLGSGVACLEDLSDSVSIPYDEVFGIKPTIAGHSGTLTVGNLKDGTTIAVFRGRFHMYEGHDWSIVTLPTRVVIEWGVPRLLLTNAAGGLNSNFCVGDLMVLSGCRDLLNPRFQKTGLLPALHEDVIDCKNDLFDALVHAGDRLSARGKCEFGELHESEKSEKSDSSDSSYEPYESDESDEPDESAESDETDEVDEFRALRQGVYVAVLGPNYETLSEIEMFRRLKCDAVGMSTVPELITARGTATIAAAVSVITNVWRDDVLMGGHQEVLEASQKASLRLDRLFRAVLGA